MQQALSSIDTCREPGRLPNPRKTFVVPEEVTIGVILTLRPHRRDHVPFYGARGQFQSPAVRYLTLIAALALAEAAVSWTGRLPCGD